MRHQHSRLRASGSGGTGAQQLQAAAAQVHNIDTANTGQQQQHRRQHSRTHIILLKPHILLLGPRRGAFSPWSLQVTPCTTTLRPVLLK